MDLSLKSETFGQSDQTWLGSAHGTDMARSATIVTAGLAAATYYPQGFLPSGTPLAQYTGGANSGKYTVYTSGGANGAGTLVGFLLDSVPIRVPGNDVVGALFDHGRVVAARLPFTVDSSGQGNVAGRIWFV